MDTMEYKGFKARIMEANRLTGDYVHHLPPGVTNSILKTWTNLDKLKHK